MPYSDKTYFLTKIAQADLDKLTGGGLTGDTNLAEAIKSADSLIDGYLQSALVAVPLVSPPDMIKQLSYDIAIYNLHDRIDFGDIPERIEKKYKATIDILQNIAKKLIIIPGLDTADKDESIKYTGEEPIIKRNSF